MLKSIVSEAIYHGHHSWCWATCSPFLRIIGENGTSFWSYTAIKPQLVSSLMCDYSSRVDFCLIVKAPISSGIISDSWLTLLLGFPNLIDSRIGAKVFMGVYFSLNYLCDCFHGSPGSGGISFVSLTTCFISISTISSGTVAGVIFSFRFYLLFYIIAIIVSKAELEVFCFLL